MEQKNNLMDEIIWWYNIDTANMVDAVLHDDEKDPQYSAVTARNRIILYIKFMRQNDSNFKINSIEGYLEKEYHEKSEIELFGKKVAAELPCFKGEICQL